MKLSKRLNKIVSLLDTTYCLADVGCDHGKVLYYIAKNNFAKKLIASDISPSSLSKAEDLLTSKGFMNCEYFVSSGFETYSDYAKEELTAFVIAGMGGCEISNILEYLINNKQKFVNLDYFILQPQNNTEMVRRLLLKHKFFITEDTMVYDSGKYYNIIKVKTKKPKLKKKYNKLSIMFGYDNLHFINHDFYAYLIQNRKMLLDIIKKSNNKKKFLRQLKQIDKIMTSYPYNSITDL